MRTKFALTALAGITIGAVAVQAIHAQTKPKVYAVNELQIVNPADIAKQAAAVEGAVKAAGGRFLATAGGKVTGIDGDAPQRVVIIEWPNADAAVQFYKTDKAFNDGMKIGAIKATRRYAVEAAN
ncbi:MAG: DUF1330 domain-containing protein [Xanthobacteraceae bacterium]|nr:DUF1330 domain-containing protein [Xanthobacteraceae bacterium]